MTTFMVDFTMTVGATRYITADNEEQALRIADALLRNKRFDEEIYESIRESMVYSDYENPQVIDSDDSWLPELSDEEYQEIYGIDMKALREED